MTTIQCSLCNKEQPASKGRYIPLRLYNFCSLFWRGFGAMVFILALALGFRHRSSLQSLKSAMTNKIFLVMAAWKISLKDLGKASFHRGKIIPVTLLMSSRWLICQAELLPLQDVQCAWELRHTPQGAAVPSSVLITPHAHLGCWPLLCRLYTPSEELARGTAYY